MDKLLITGTVIQLQVQGKDFTKDLLIERIGRKFLFAEVSNPYHRLHIYLKDDNNCNVRFMIGSPSRENTFQLIETLGGLATFIIELQNKDKAKNVVSCALALDDNEHWCAIPLVSECDRYDKSCEFIVKAVCAGDSLSLPRPLFLPEHQFTRWELQRFVLEGYLKISSLADKIDVDNCTATLNYEIGIPGRLVSGGVQDEHSLGKFSGDMSNSGVVRKLLGGRVAAAVDALIGRGNYNKANLSAQIAYRFPEPREKAKSKSPRIVWHTDGLRQGRSHGFSLLVGICLSDVTDLYQGNLAVWPGSHLLLHQCKLPPYGALDIGKLNALTREKQCFSSFYDPHADKIMEMPPQKEFHNNEPELPTLGSPLQLCMKSGDVVFLHPDLAHAGAQNINSSEIRRMLYFRVKISTNSTGTSGKQASSLFNSWEEVEVSHERDMWCDLPGVRSQLGESLVNGLMQLFS